MRSASSAGCGLPVSTGPATSWRTGWAVAETRGPYSSRPCWNPFGITRFCPDPWGAYARHLAPETQVPGKRPQQSERKQVTLRTPIKRLARKTICLSTSPELHDIVIGLFVNRHEFGLSV